MSNRRRSLIRTPVRISGGAWSMSASSAARYAELHAHSAFSFLDGASHPEELAAEAARLGLAALAVTDHDGLYGVVRFAEAARVVGLPTVFGAELHLPAPGRLGSLTSGASSGGGMASGATRAAGLVRPGTARLRTRPAAGSARVP